MGKIKFVISLIFLIVFFIVLSGYVIAQSTEEQQPTKEQLEAFQSAKTVRIVVDQSYGVAESMSLPFEEIAKILIKHAGLQVASPDAKVYDLKLTIVARGQGLSRYYKNVEMSLYTVASLGEIMDYRAIEPLIATLYDENHEVKKKAIWALKKITGEDFGEDLGKWQKWWKKNKEKFIKDN